VAAFLRGDVGHGLAEVEAVLLSLIDAAMDVLPVAGATSSAARRHSRATIARPDETTGALQVSTPQQVRHTLEALRGYEYEQEISFAACNRAPKGFIATFIATPMATS
jgi:hypothetical protein